MGNAFDCDYCNNRGKPWSFGCPRCGKFDKRTDEERRFEDVYRVKKVKND